MLANTAFDNMGFLRELNDWTPGVAEQIAATEGISLLHMHWELITLIREYYEEFESSPAMRPLVKYTALKLGRDKGNSMYLLSLFPGSPAKVCSKIAGLPRPDYCL